MPATTSLPRSANSGPRWSIVGMPIACNTRSGTLVGPGICRKWRPVWAGAVFFIGAPMGSGLAQLGAGAVLQFAEGKAGDHVADDKTAVGYVDHRQFGI